MIHLTTFPALIQLVSIYLSKTQLSNLTYFYCDKRQLFLESAQDRKILKHLST